MDIKVKLCGFTNKDTLDLAVSLGVNFIGLVFCESSLRNISIKNACAITNDLPKNVKKVAVFADINLSKMAEIVVNLKPDFLQIHGDQSFEEINHVKNLFNMSIIKAIAIKKESDLKKIDNYKNVADMFLFDSKVEGVEGGTGKVFDWNILRNLNMKQNWFLSGGLNAYNIENALKITGAKIIDLSSGIEEKKGVKSKKLITDFMNKINSL